MYYETVRLILKEDRWFVLKNDKSQYPYESYLEDMARKESELIGQLIHPDGSYTLTFRKKPRPFWYMTVIARAYKDHPYLVSSDGKMIDLGKYLTEMSREGWDIVLTLPITSVGELLVLKKRSILCPRG